MTGLLHAVRRDAPGLTLLELLVALGLVSILAGIASLEYQTVRSRLALMTAVQQVAADLKGARARAVGSSTPHRVAFAPGGVLYVWHRRVGAQYAEGGRRHLPRGVLIADCSARDGAMTFTARGTASSFGTLVIENERGERRAVVVDIAGRVRVE